MKRINAIILMALLLAIGLGNAKAQVVDICAGNDTVELHLGNYKYGYVQWQVSEDNAEWQNIEGAIDTVYRFLPERARYYRAEVRFPSCSEYNYHSQVSYVQIPPKAFAGPDLTLPAGMVARMNASCVEGATGTWEIIEGTGGLLENPSDCRSGFIGEEGEYKLTWTLTNSCGSNTDTVSIKCVRMEYQTDLVIVDETDAILSDSTQRLNGEYIISFNDPVPDIQVGSVMLGYMYPSFLRKVVSFEREGNLFTMQTEAAALTDVILAGAINVDPINDTIDGKKPVVKYLDRFPTRKELQDDPFLLRDGSVYAIRKSSKDGPFEDFEFEAEYTREGYLNVRLLEFDFKKLNNKLDGLKYSSELRVYPNFNANIEFTNGEFKEARMGLYDARLELIQNIRLTKPLTTTLVDKSGYFNKNQIVVGGFLIGLIPTFITLDLPYLFKVQAAIEPPMSFTLTSGIPFTLELYYNDVTGQFDTRREKGEPYHTFHSEKPIGTVGAKFNTGLKASVLIADVFGPYFEVNGNFDPSICASAETGDIGGNINMGVDLKLGCRFQLFSHSVTLFDRCFDFRVIDHDEPAPKKVIKYSGDNQIYTYGQYLNAPVGVKVTGWFNTPMPFAYVHFMPENGTVSESVVATDINGIATTRWKPGIHYGMDRLKVEVYNCQGELAGETPQFFHAYTSATDPCINADLTVEAYKVNENTIIPLVHGGKQPYLYSIDGESYSTNAPEIHLQFGHTYCFYVIDDNGCEAQAYYTGPSYDCNNTTLQLATRVNGNSVFATAMFGFEPYQFFIDGKDFHESSSPLSGLNMYTFGDLFDGEYTVRVKDNLGCERSQQITISRTGNLTLSLSEIENCTGTACVLTQTNTLIERGVCWSSHHTPTVQDFRVSYGTGTGNYTFTITALDPSTTYYVRAYALDGSGTSYSREVCINPNQGPTLPLVASTGVTNVTPTSAYGSGNVTYDGGSPVVERGICWGMNHNPTVAGYHLPCSSGTGAFTGEITDLIPNMTYYVRAYATNSVGTAYGLEVDFFTGEGGGSEVPTGAINGLFSVAPGYQVYFSQGNLQYQPSTSTWRFAENQFDLLHSINEMVQYDENMGAYYCDVTNEYNSYYSGWIDMFGWGTSGYNHGAVCYQPWSVSQNDADYMAYGNVTNSLNDQTGQADWGYNAISNGGNQQCQWRTLNGGEWVFLLDCRNTGSGVRFAKAKVGGVDGVIVLPDNWQVSTFSLNNVNQKDAGFSSNNIGLSSWMVLEEAGAVFLPASGARIGTKLYNKAVDEHDPMEESTLGEYWSSSIFPGFVDEHYPSNLSFAEEWIRPRDNFYRSFGCGVRLVHEGQGTQLQGYSPWEFGPTGGGTGPGSITTESYTFLGLPYYGSCPILEKGACWSLSPNPTLADNHIAGEEGTEYVRGTIHGLTPNTTYYLRMFVSDSFCTYYSDEIVFTTLPDGGGGNDMPEGAINGVFSVGEGRQVCFSKGNLQYQASTNTWRFAENQWDYVGDATSGSVYENGVKCNNDFISPTYSGWIDLFGWGTSGYNHGAVCYQPWSQSQNNSDYYAYGNADYDLNDSNGQADWGFNAIVGGGNQTNNWRTLTDSEWEYVLNGRTTQSGMRFVFANVNDVNGLILLPDDWDESIYPFVLVNEPANFINNVINAASWSLLETNGAVFLPPNGTRYPTYLEGTGYDHQGQYWSASKSDAQIVRVMGFGRFGNPPIHYICNPHSAFFRYDGIGVRLVHDITNGRGNDDDGLGRE